MDIFTGDNGKLDRIVEVVEGVAGPLVPKKLIKTFDKNIQKTVFCISIYYNGYIYRRSWQTRYNCGRC